MDVLANASQSLSDLRFKMPSLSPSATPAAGSGAIDKSSALYQACEDFQSIFIKQMLDTMRKTVDKSGGLIEPNQGEKVFEDMLYDEYAKRMSKTAGFDLADSLYRQMAFLQTIPKAANPSV